MMVHLAVDDARTAQKAGLKFARDLAGAVSADLTMALAKQVDMSRRANMRAGFTAEQAQLAAERFETAARAEWERITAAGGTVAYGRA